MNLIRQIKQNNPQFWQKLKIIARKLGTRPEWLLAVMWSESRLKANVINSIGCAGLIQFCPQTYQAWGLTAIQIASMPAVEQLDLVYRYFKQWKDKGIKFNRPENLYLTAFYPLALLKGWHKNKNYVIGSERSQNWARKIAQQNKGFDIDGDGLITIKDFRKYNKQLLNKLGIKSFWWLWIVLLLIILLALGFYFYQNGKLQLWLKQLK